GIAVLACSGVVVKPQGDACEKQSRQHGFTSQPRLAEELLGYDAKTTGLEQATFIEEHQGLIQVDERGPNLVFLRNEHCFRICKQLQCLKSLSLLTGSDSSECKRFGS